MTNLPDAKAKQLPASGSTSLGSPRATSAPKTVTKDGTLVVRPSVAAPKAKPAAKKAPSKTTAKKSTTKPVAKKATATKTSAKPAAKAASKPVAKKAVAKKAVAKKAVAKKPVAKAAAKSTTKKVVAKKAVAKKPVVKAATKSTAKKAVAKKAVAKKAVAKKAVAKKTTTKAAPKAATPKKTVAKKAVAKKPVAKAATKQATPKKTTAKKTTAKKSTKTTSSRVSAATASLGESIYRSVEDVIATGKTAKDAFAVVAKSQKLTVSNVQQHYYRFKRKAQTGTKKASTSSRSTVSKVQGKALGAAVTAVGKLPAKQRKQVAKGVSAAAKGTGRVTAASKEAREDLTHVVEDILGQFQELLKEARKNPQFRKAEKKIAARFSK